MQYCIRGGAGAINIFPPQSEFGPNLLVYIIYSWLLFLDYYDIRSPVRKVLLEYGEHAHVYNVIQIMFPFFSFQL